MKKDKENMVTYLKLCKFCKVKCDNKECDLIPNDELLKLFRKSKHYSFPKFLDEVLENEKK